MADILTIRQVAELCAVVPSTVQYWERKGFLSSFKTLGGHRRFRKEEVLAFLDCRGRKLSNRNADLLLHAKFKEERRKEQRLDFQCAIEAELINGEAGDTRCQGQITDVSNHGFGIVLSGADAPTTLQNFIKKFHTVKAWIKDEAGFLKNPLIGTIRNIRQNSDQIRIGLALT
jgi:excisionase family DNA binding protein